MTEACKPGVNHVWSRLLSELEMTLTKAFAGLQDPRTGPAQLRDLGETILMALCAVLCGEDS